MQNKIKHLIAVASGKGGVGKSSVAVNLALALLKSGASVGILDADIYGPSIPSMLGCVGAKPVVRDKTIAPILAHGLKSMSIGYLVDTKASLAWRGPMLGKALEQMLNDTLWGELDYLIVDLPPGTGDIQLTLCQKMPVSGALIVTTPQDLALVDVRRACEMFTMLNVPMLGVIENMSVYHCPSCHHEEKIFGEGGAKQLAEEYHLALLGSIPLTLNMRLQTDAGTPPVVADATSKTAWVFQSIADKVRVAVAALPKDYSRHFPKVVVEKTDKQEKNR